MTNEIKQIVKVNVTLLQSYEGFDFGNQIDTLKNRIKEIATINNDKSINESKVIRAILFGSLGITNDNELLEKVSLEIEKEDFFNDPIFEKTQRSNSNKIERVLLFYQLQIAIKEKDNELIEILQNKLQKVL